VAKRGESDFGEGLEPLWESKSGEMKRGKEAQAGRGELVIPVNEQ
jgi:hypothetical protein